MENIWIPVSFRNFKENISELLSHPFVLEIRNKIFLKILIASGLLLLAIYFLIISSLSEISKIKDQISELQSQFTQVHKISKNLAISEMSKSSQKGELTEFFYNSMDKSGFVAPDIKKNNNAYIVSLEEAKFEKLMQWLMVIRSTSTYGAVSATMVRKEQSDLVKVNLELREID